MSQDFEGTPSLKLSEASAVEVTGDATFAAEIAPGWDILGNTNGGYLLATLARAMTRSSEREAPLTLTGHYLAPTTPGVASIQTQVLKSGKRLATASGHMSSDGKPLVTALGAFGAHSQSPEVILADGEPPVMPVPAESIRMKKGASADGSDNTAMPPPFMDRIDLRLHPEDAGFGVGKPSGTPRMRAWFRLLNNEPIDSFGLVLAADCLPPTIFNSGLPIGWTPTVELTVHVRTDPAPGWVRLDFATRFINDGLLEVDGLIWDSRDRLVAQSRQLALVPSG